MQLMKAFARLLLVPAVALAASIPPAAESALEGITTDAFEGHVRFLADDLLEGRAAGTRGYDVAAAYVAAHFRKLGLRPAGDPGSYYQQVPFIQSTSIRDEAAMILHRRSGDHALTVLDDFIVQANPHTETAAVRAPVVFAGFGITAPELGWNDYAEIEAEGKVVILLAGGPNHFPATLRAHHSSSAEKAANAVRHGAVGLITLRGPQSEKRYSWERYRSQNRRTSLRWVGPDGRIGKTHPELRVTATINRSGAEALFQGAKRSLSDVFALEGDPKKPLAFALPGEITLSSQSRHERITSPNVAAILPGSDPSLAPETIVYTAHLDHLGIVDPVDGDSIANGVFDNASGTAALLEAASAFAALPVPPRRSILFLAVTAEEKGLLGSDYFAHYPTIDRERIVANVNMDMFMMIYPLRDVLVYGVEHSTLARHVARAAEVLGVSTIADPAPEEAAFVRSDQYSFVRQGVPAIAINEGADAGGGPGSALEAFTEWRRTRYHRPSDDFSQPIEWEAGRDLARFGFLIGYFVAEDPERPRWNERDFFGRTFGR